jgi:hypothetical protein
VQDLQTQAATVVDDDRSMTISQFCVAENISLPTFYKLVRLKKAPRTYRVPGTAVQRIPRRSGARGTSAWSNSRSARRVGARPSGGGSWRRGPRRSAQRASDTSQRRELRTPRDPSTNIERRRR